MEQRIAQTLRTLRGAYALFWLLPAVWVTVCECHDFFNGFWADEARASYWAESITILLTAFCVPLSLKLFARVLRRIDNLSIEQALRCYLRWSVVRLVWLMLPLVAGLFTYYATFSHTGLLCALIALTASLFCCPGDRRLRSELHIERGEARDE